MDNVINEPLPQDGEPSRVGDFKRVCVRLGLMMIVVFVSRTVCTVSTRLMQPLLVGMGGTAAYVIETLMSLVFLYFVPMTSAALLLKEPTAQTRKRLYSKPLYFGRAMGMFPAFYGVAIATNFLTILVGMLFSETDLYKSFNTVNDLEVSGMASTVILFVQLAVIAPLFEEFWFRGIVMESLRPYGNGFAIFVSALLFGITHANFQQFFYATVLGICLGYIAVSTQSIVTTTIMHAMFNSISGLLLLFMADESVGDYMLYSGTGQQSEKTVMVYLWLSYMVLILLLMAVGILMAISKLRKIRRYRVPKVWTEISTAKRWGIFLSRPSVIGSLVLAADTFTLALIPHFLYTLFT